MTIKEGDRLPEAKLATMTEGGPETIELPAAWAGKRVALFSVPGAFTPTCSARHLPGFVEQKGALEARGIDLVACTAVNDMFVMAAWAKQAGAEGITMLADGNGEFVRALGLEMDGTGFGLGRRGQRFAMVVDDGTVEKLWVEEPGEFRVSSAEHMLAEL